jgi:hypothetical protein
MLQSIFITFSCERTFNFSVHFVCISCVGHNLKMSFALRHEPRYRRIMPAHIGTTQPATGANMQDLLACSVSHAECVPGLLVLQCLLIEITILHEVYLLHHRHKPCQIAYIYATCILIMMRYKCFANKRKPSFKCQRQKLWHCVILSTFWSAIRICLTHIIIVFIEKWSLKYSGYLLLPCLWVYAVLNSCLAGVIVLYYTEEWNIFLISLQYLIVVNEGGSQDSSVSIVTGYGLNGLGLIPSNARFFSSPCVQSSSGAHPASCTMGTRGSFPKGKVMGLKLTSHLNPVSRSRMVELYLHSPMCLHGITNWTKGKLYL